MMFETEYFSVRAVRVRVREREGLRYSAAKYNPIGDVQGRTQVTLEFPRGDGRVLFEHEGEREYFEEIGVYYLTDHEFSTDDENNGLVTMTLIIDSIDPDEVENKLVQYKVALEGHYKTESEDE
ncbi:hypothetical protein SAMN04488063_1119 [Halopelagius inordinatus]|uniref:Uncharacterized protein n=2 Tax=Halopelagius inordinatus TaxID=553467 RepID=A0A1I2NDQ4_9EURY|nr:hypothetical protein SAMN04488063_1119 [Halopelagius inordinatus]